MKFKQGDKVTPVETYGPFTLGEVYTVYISYHTRGDDFINVRGFHGGYYPYRFTFVKPVKPYNKSDWM